MMVDGPLTLLTLLREGCSSSDLKKTSQPRTQSVLEEEHLYEYDAHHAAISHRHPCHVACRSDTLGSEKLAGDL